VSPPADHHQRAHMVKYEPCLCWLCEHVTMLYHTWQGLTNHAKIYHGCWYRPRGAVYHRIADCNHELARAKVRIHQAKRR